ncbi:hypothetical protein B0H13DRAFT_2669965 [Mycena leptocephala]|nr:hypothetical protein B0H13DRAFT_2669965 [Mycena leptocephala]
MPAISGSIFRRTLRRQHLAQKSNAGTSFDSQVVPMVQVQPHPSLPAATRFVYALLILPLPLLGAAVQLTQIQRRRAARAHYCPRVVTPESSSLAIFHLFFPFPALVLCVCEHLLIATHRSTSSCYASPHVLRLGLGGAWNRRRLRLARCAGFWSSLQLADLFLYFVQFHIAFPSFILYYTLFPSSPSSCSLYLFHSTTHPHSLGLADIHFTNAVYSRYCHVSPHRAAWCLRESVHIIGPVRRAGENARYGTSLRTTTTAPPATGTRARLPGPPRCSKAVRKGNEGVSEGKVTPSLYDPSRLPFTDIGFYSLTAVLWAVRPPRRAEETLDESAEPRHTAPARAAWCIRGWVWTAGAVPATGARAWLPGPLASVRRTTAMDILITTSATQRKVVTKGKVGARAGKAKSRRRPTEYDVRESGRGRGRGVLGRVRSISTSCAHAATCLEDGLCDERGENEGTEHLDHDWPLAHSRLCSRSASYDRIMMTGIGIGIANRRIDRADDGHARARMGGDGEEERELERGKGSNGALSPTRGRRIGRGEGAGAGVLGKVPRYFLSFGSVAYRSDYDRLYPPYLDIAPARRVVPPRMAAVR